jgi:hypothetical protein
MSLLCSFWETFHLLSASDKDISKMSARSFCFVGEVAVKNTRFYIQKWKMSVYASRKICMNPKSNSLDKVKFSSFVTNLSIRLDWEKHADGHISACNMLILFLVRNA